MNVDKPLCVCLCVCVFVGREGAGGGAFTKGDD